MKQINLETLQFYKKIGYNTENDTAIPTYIEIWDWLWEKCRIHISAWAIGDKFHPNIQGWQDDQWKPIYYFNTDGEVLSSPMECIEFGVEWLAKHLRPKKGKDNV